MNVTPRGWKVGANDVLVQGSGMTPSTQLVLDVPGAAIETVSEDKPSPNQLKYKATLPPQAAAGVYEVRLANEQGLTEAALVIVDALANAVEAEPNNNPTQAQAITLPAAVEGRLSGPESDFVAFDGNKGQRLVAEIAGRRLGCSIKPVLRLLAANFLELQVAYGSRSLGGDARLVATLPGDGLYYVELHDLVYRGDNKQYRLLLGDLQVAGGVFPLGGKRGTTLPLRFFGGTLASEVEMPLALPATGAASVLGVSLSASQLASPLPLAVAVSDRDETLEQPGADGNPQRLAVPGIVNGRLTTAGEQDRYQIEVTAGAKLHLYLEAERLGTPLDAVLEILGDKGTALMTQDDGPGTADPDFLYTVPAGVSSLTIGVADVNRRGGPAFVYRLIVEPAPQGLPFELSLLSPLVNVPAGGSASVRVRAARRDYTGPIRLKLAGDVPAGIKLSGDQIGEKATDTLLSLTAPADAPLRAGTLEVVGEGIVEGQPPIVRTAKLAKQPPHEAFPWLQSRFAGAVTQAGLLTLEVEPGEPAFLRGLEYTAKVKVRRAPEQTGPINLTVQTSQAQVQGQVNIPNPPAVTIPENADEGTIEVRVPNNANEQPLAYVVTGQLLNAKDKKTAVGTAESASVSTRVALPFSLEVAPSQELKRGVRNLLAVKLVRLGSFNEPIQVALSGLSPSIRTAPLTVAPGVSELQIPLAISPAQAAGPIPNVKLTATWALTPPLAAPPLDLPLNVSAADPPGVLEIFDDGADFVAALTEGPGSATIDTAEVFSGKECVAIKGAQKSRLGLPGLNVPIVESPMPGQYRFLRFAWKKKGGSGIAVALAANNRLGAASAKGTDYRYTAGAAGAGGKAIKLADAPPQEWTVITRDLFTDHGPFSLTGLALLAIDGEAALFDHIYLARSETDLPPPPGK